MGPFWRHFGTEVLHSGSADVRLSDSVQQRLQAIVKDSVFTEEEMNERYEDLRRVSLFETLGDAEIALAAKMVEVRHVKAKTIIYNQGDDGLDCFIVQKGELVAKVQTLRGDWMPTKDYGVGKYFGEKALVRNERRTATINARTECTQPAGRDDRSQKMFHS